MKSETQTFGSTFRDPTRLACRAARSRPTGGYEQELSASGACIAHVAPRCGPSALVDRTVLMS